MRNRLVSVGVDVGTTTTQLIVSELMAENRASSFAVPKMEITGRKILYESRVFFTPLLTGELVDGDQIRRMVASEYERAGIGRNDVDTGAIIITGETSRKENAAAVLAALSDFAGDFVVATAGPDLESVLAAKGAGAVSFSGRTGKTVLHMDIGGGTSNLAWIEDGRITATSCLNVGGRLLKFDAAGYVTYVSPVLQGLCAFRVGDKPSEQQVMSLARLLASALEMAAGLRQRDVLLERLHTHGAGTVRMSESVVISFSGGVADCIDKEHSPFAFSDMGVLLGRAIRESALCRGEYRLGEQTIRATVIGAGCHSAQLSGSTVYYRNVSLPLKNLPVAQLSEMEQTLPVPELAGLIRQRMEALEEQGVLSLPGWNAPDYEKVTALADAIAGSARGAVYIALEADMAKALGHALALRLPKEMPCLCIDRVQLERESYLDIGKTVGPAISVVVKTLILSREG